MSRRTAMQRPPRLSVVDAVECDDEAATCSARDSRVALAGLEMRPLARSGVSYIEDSDVVSSVGNDPDSVTSFAARPSYVARGEIVTSETPVYSPEAFAPTEAFEIGLTREEPLLPISERSFENAPAFVDHTMQMPASTPTPMASVRPVYHSQMMSVPPPPESWVESPWVMPSTRAQSFAPPAPRDTRSLLQTIAIVGTGVLMLAIVFGAVLFARSDSEERMEFSPQRANAVMAPPPPAATTLGTTPSMQVITAPATPAMRPRVVATAAPVAAPTVVATVVRPPVVVTPPRAKEPLPPKARVEAPKPVVKAAPEAAKKTKEEESVEALLKKLGEEQLSR